MQATWVQSLIGELRSHMPHGVAKKQTTVTKSPKPTKQNRDNNSNDLTGMLEDSGYKAPKKLDTQWDLNTPEQQQLLSQPSCGCHDSSHKTNTQKGGWSVCHQSSCFPPASSHRSTSHASLREGWVREGLYSQAVSTVFQQFRNTWPRSAPASLITISLEVFAPMSHSFLISAFPTPLADGPLLCLPQPGRPLSRRDHRGPQGLGFQQAAWALRGSCRAGSTAVVDQMCCLPLSKERGVGREEQVPQTGNNRTLTWGAVILVLGPRP